MKETRRYIRFNCPVKVNYEVFNEYAHPKQAYTKDISRGGLRLVLNEDITTQSQIKMYIHVPKEKEPIDAIAEVMWVRKDVEKNAVHTGLKFIKISPADKSRILQHAYEFWKETVVTKEK